MAATSRADAGSVGGDADLAAVGALLADRSRARILLALDDGRALPASRLAGEAGVAAPTASEHLRRLVDAGLLVVEPQGRHRYYRLAGPEVGRLIEAVGRLAPRQPVRSLREGTRAEALRRGRTCYDHLAGRLGVALMERLLALGHLEGGDGRHHPEAAVRDRLSARGHDLDYRLTPTGSALLADLGVALPPRRRAVGYCVDWTEQAHHLAGAAGTGLHVRLHALGWIESTPVPRAVRVTDAGRRGLADLLGLVEL